MSQPLPFLSYGRQCLDAADIAAVTAVLESDFLTCGPDVDAFESAFAKYVGARHAVAVNSGTAALHLAMRVAEIGSGDRVLTTPNTFLASANAVAFVGATPDFADIDEVSHTLCPQSLARQWDESTRAVVAVDYAGQAADMPAIAEVARKHGGVVIEDACHAVGGKFRHADLDYSIGGHPWADMTTYSFHPVKTMTTGEGGMLVTDNDEYARRARVLRTHGVERNRDCFEGLGMEVGPLAESGPWVYEMHELGYNYRITDLQCALGQSQLKKLPGFIRRRQEIVQAYNEAFGGLSLVETPQTSPLNAPELVSWHLYTLQIDFARLGRSRTEVMDQLRSQGIGTQVLYIPVYLQPWYRKTYGYGPGKCPHAEAFYAKALSIPLFPAMTDSDVTRVVETIRAVLA